MRRWIAWLSAPVTVGTVFSGHRNGCSSSLEDVVVRFLLEHGVKGGPVFAAFPPDQSLLSDIHRYVTEIDKARKRVKALEKAKHKGRHYGPTEFEEMSEEEIEDLALTHKMKRIKRPVRACSVPTVEGCWCSQDHQVLAFRRLLRLTPLQQWSCGEREVCAIAARNGRCDADASSDFTTRRSLLIPGLIKSTNAAFAIASSFELGDSAAAAYCLRTSSP